MHVKLSGRKSACAKHVAQRSSRNANRDYCARSFLGDRLVVGLRTLTPPTGVRIPLPQPNKKRAPSGALFLFGRGKPGFETCSTHAAAQLPVRARSAHPSPISTELHFLLLRSLKDHSLWYSCLHRKMNIRELPRMLLVRNRLPLHSRRR